MALDSSSTPAEIEAAYLDNSNYDSPPNLTAAYAFVQACRAILLRRPARASRAAGGGGSQSAEWDLEHIKTELDRAQQWLAFCPAAQAAAGTNSDTTFPDFSFSRDY
jgi:hypothetical protein